MATPRALLHAPLIARSVSFLQRHLRLGPHAALHLAADLERLGVGVWTRARGPAPKRWPGWTVTSSGACAGCCHERRSSRPGVLRAAALIAAADRLVIAAGAGLDFRFIAVASECDAAKAQGVLRRPACRNIWVASS